MHLWRKVLYVGGPTVVVAGLGAFYVWANQSVTVAPQVQSAQTESESARPTQALAGRTYSVTVDAAYKVRDRVTNGPSPVVESLYATQTMRGSGALAITVATLPAGGINDTPDVRWRLERTDLYERISLPSADESVVSFRSMTDNEVSVFWPNGSRYAAIALTNSQTEYGTTTVDEMARLVQNWAWAGDSND